MLGPILHPLPDKDGDLGQSGISLQSFPPGRKLSLSLVCHSYNLNPAIRMQLSGELTQLRSDTELRRNQQGDEDCVDVEESTFEKASVIGAQRKGSMYRQQFDFAAKLKMRNAKKQNDPSAQDEQIQKEDDDANKQAAENARLLEEIKALKLAAAQSSGNVDSTKKPKVQSIQ